MNQDKFTIKSAESLRLANSIAGEMKHQEVGPEHLLLALIDKENQTNIVPILEKIGVDSAKIESELKTILESRPNIEGSALKTYFSSDIEALISKAYEEMVAMGDDYISTEHLLISLVIEKSKAATVLKSNGVSKENILAALAELRGSDRVTDTKPEETFDILKKYTRNLTDLAIRGKLDPVIGRDSEIRRTIQVLSRRTKNNPILLGAPGVGKTAIAEGIAIRIAEKDVPETMKSKILLSLDLGAMVAGAKYRGEFEERLKSVLKRIEESQGKIILFIDEIHSLVGAGASEGSLDASNMLKPALARGDLHCIGATTIKEYRKYLEKDKALERRFQPVLIVEPSEEDAIHILRGLKSKYEAHHGIAISEGSIVSAVKLSRRYLPDRQLPDKAIDLIDEAASKIKMEIESVPIEIDVIQRKITKMEMEREAFSREKGKEAKEKLKEVSKDIKELNATAKVKLERWKQEKDIIQKLRNFKKEQDELETKVELLKRNGDLAEASHILYGSLPELENRKKEMELKYKELTKNGSYLREMVTKEDIASIVAQWTGIPVERMLENESSKLINLEKRMHKRVVGQEQGVKSVSDAIRRARAGLQDPNRPLGAFIFAGPTGVGKTEVARALSEVLFDDEHMMVRLDMSEYMEKYSVSRLIGAPPGYIGHDEGGQLTEAVRRKPYSVILLDEIEKAHPEVFNVLLQVLDEGRLTDSKGNVVDFKNSVLILTTNLGSDYSLSESEEVAQLKVEEALKKNFRPEFLNRIDDIVVFHPLSKENLSKIIKIQIEKLMNRLKEREIKLTISDEAVNLLIETGYDPIFGARPLKREIQRKLVNPLASDLIRGKFSAGDTIKVSVSEKGKEKKLVFA